jgi:Bacterial DNA-binding protein
MEKQRIIDQVSKDARITKSQASKALNELYDFVADELQGRDMIELGGFGTFRVIRGGSGSSKGSYAKVPLKDTLRGGGASAVFIPGDKSLRSVFDEIG